jgi:hypothetical protein
MHDDSALSRRLRLASQSTAAMTPAAALAATEDPVFAAIARHREAERALAAALHDDAYGQAAIAALDRAHDALVDWLTTSPTTMAGVLATLDYAASPLGGEPGDRTVLSDVWDSAEWLERPVRQFPALVAAALRKLVTHRSHAIRSTSSPLQSQRSQTLRMSAGHTLRYLCLHVRSRESRIVGPGAIGRPRRTSATVCLLHCPTEWLSRIIESSGAKP